MIVETVTRRLPELVRTDNECDDATRRLKASRASAQPAWHTTAPSSARPPRTLQHGFPTAASAVIPVNPSTAAFHAMIRNSWSRTKSGSPDRYCCAWFTPTESDTESLDARIGLARNLIPAVREGVCHRIHRLDNERQASGRSMT